MRALSRSRLTCTIEEFLPESSQLSIKWDSSSSFLLCTHLPFSPFPLHILSHLISSYLILIRIASQYLLKDLVERGIWTPEVRNQIIADRGSVQGVSAISQDVKDLYKTVWEIKQKAIIDQAADRGAFICQSQSLNIHMAEPTTARLTSMHFYAWKRGLKTGMYYLRTRPKGTYYIYIIHYVWTLCTMGWSIFTV